MFWRGVGGARKLRISVLSPNCAGGNPAEFAAVGGIFRLACANTERFGSFRPADALRPHTTGGSPRADFDAESSGSINSDRARRSPPKIGDYARRSKDEGPLAPAQKKSTSRGRSIQDRSTGPDRRNRATPPPKRAPRTRSVGGEDRRKKTGAGQGKEQERIRNYRLRGVNG